MWTGTAFTLKNWRLKAVSFGEGGPDFGGSKMFYQCSYAEYIFSILTQNRTLAILHNYTVIKLGDLQEIEIEKKSLN